MKQLTFSGSGWSSRARSVGFVLKLFNETDFRTVAFFVLNDLLPNRPILKLLRSQQTVDIDEPERVFTVRKKVVSFSSTIFTRKRME